MKSGVVPAFRELELLRKRTIVAGRSISVIRALVIGSLALGVWGVVRPGDDIGLLIIAATGFLATLITGRERSRSSARYESFLLHLEMRHPEVSVSAFELLRTGEQGRKSADATAAWTPAINAELSEFRRSEIHRHLNALSSLILPTICAAAALWWSPPTFSRLMTDVREAVAMLQSGSTLTILQGPVRDIKPEPLTLSPSKPIEVELLAQNLTRIDTTLGASSRTPTVELRKTSASGLSEVFQSFQMQESRGSTDSITGALRTWTVQVSISDSVDLVIPTTSNNVLAKISVRQLPVPRVKLRASVPVTDPWPDDMPLPLEIEATAENSLASIRLAIRSGGGRASYETVNNVMIEDKKSITTDYRLLLEPFLESDLAEVEIIAEAIDRSIPNALIGQSEPLKINTASAYGRYKQTLATLRELKTAIDEAIETQKKALPPESRGLSKKAQTQSENSPFFDGLDRVTIEKFDQLTQSDRLFREDEGENILDLSENLNQFLFEHEILDDRERDRDFFVAVRSLSRLVEQKPATRPVTVAAVAKRLSGFLDDREKRWRMRVERLPRDSVPGQWPKVRDQRPFHASMRSVAELDTKATPESNAEALATLSRATVDFRGWIEELEAKEDEVRNKRDQERQQGLASARNELRELQKRQGEISAELDRATDRKPADMNASWPSTRLKQNTNARETAALEGKMRSLSPGAGARIKAAAEAMESTIKSGNEKDFALAESAADLSGRLLRQAEQATRREQPRNRERGRRRRVTGDNYYGQSVVGGDIEIKREYQVDKRYREDILDEVRGSNVEDEDRALLDDYLRQVIR